MNAPPPLKTHLPAPFTFSQSSLQDYADCPRRFQLRYIERLAWPAIETEPALANERRQLEGQLFHRLVQQNLLGIPSEKLEPLATGANLRRWWEHWVDFHKTQELGKIHPEVTLSAPLGKHRLLAKYDLISVSPQGLFIYDWKTYAHRPRNERMSSRLQTRVYRALLAVAGAHLNGETTVPPEKIEMVYWYADYPAEPARFPYTANQFNHDWDYLQKLASEITSIDQFELTRDDKACQYCTFRSYCNRGVRAGESEDLESELAALEITLEQAQEIEF